MKRLISVTLVLILTGILIGIFAWRRITKPTDAIITIGIIQTASHPALDAAREGFLAQSTQQWGDSVQHVVQNAQGSIVNAHAIAESFHARTDIDAVFAIATPAAKAIASIETIKPIFIAAVTDPHAIGLMHPETNVTGSIDMVNIAGLLEIIQHLAPESHTVGILYNVAEINSVVLTEKMEQQLRAAGFTPVIIGVTNESELGGALDAHLHSLDVLLAPTDNTVASAIKFIAHRALQAKKPFIVSDNLLVQHGALAARGVDYHESGKQAARAAMRILQDGKKPHEIPLAHPKQGNIIVNQQVLATLGLTVPNALSAQVELINTTKQLP